MSRKVRCIGALEPRDYKRDPLVPAGADELLQRVDPRRVHVAERLGIEHEPPNRSGRSDDRIADPATHVAG
jgi:hypothetical protein